MRAQRERERRTPLCLECASPGMILIPERAVHLVFYSHTSSARERYIKSIILKFRGCYIIGNGAREWCCSLEMRPASINIFIYPPRGECMRARTFFFPPMSLVISINFYDFNINIKLLSWLDVSETHFHPGAFIFYGRPLEK
jgi:hypothetical protein